MALLLSVLPIALLIYLMVKPKGLPSYVALPAIALLVYVLQLGYFSNAFMVLNANVLAGMLATLTPITIIFGAVLFNQMMAASGNISVLQRWLGNISPNPVAQLMIIGWAFAFMIEGASGFGTPAAIAAPILMSLGYPPFKVAVFTLVMNSVPVSFGAVGTPTWFGFEPLKLSEAVILEVGQLTSMIHFVAALVIAPLALTLIVSWQSVKRNWLYVYLSVLACTVPYYLLAQVNYEFPSLVGGAIGLLLSVVLANKGVGLERIERASEQPVDFAVVMRALLPIFMLIVILVVTRIPQLGIKGLLTDATRWLALNLGALGQIEVSQSLIVAWKDILSQGVGADYKTLYVPALIPFVVTVAVSVFIYKLPRGQARQIFSQSFAQVKKPFLALLGALVMVKLMLAGGERSMVIIIGESFAAFAGDKWTYFASYLGAIGAFFSGSNTVSNLTFGGIQLSIAEATSLSVPLVLALQSVGGAMGNMVCLNNIIAVCGVLDVNNQEGAVLRKTFAPMLVYGVIAAIVAVLLLVMGRVG